MKRPHFSPIIATIAAISVCFVAALKTDRAKAFSANNYEPKGKIVASLDFDPKVDGFGFDNYTVEEHDGSRDLGAADLVRMFGASAVCKNQGATAANCVLKASARGWMEENLEGMDGGHCEGMAVSCLRFKSGMTFKGKSAPRDYQTGIANTYGLKLDPKIANNIAYFWATQSFDEIDDVQRVYRKLGPLGIVNKLIQTMNDGSETFTFGICKRNGTECEEGHAVTPFAVEDMGTYFRVHVYDNNYAGETRFLTVEKGGKNTWKYTAATNPNKPPDVYTGDKTTNSLDIVPTSKREGQCFVASFDDAEKPATGCKAEPSIKRPVSKPVEGPKKPVAATAKPAVETPVVPAPTTKYVDLMLTGDGDMMIIDSKDRRLGYDPEADAYFYEIPGGKEANLTVGKGFDLPRYKIPVAKNNEPYVVVFSGDNIEEESQLDFVFTGPGFTVGLDGIKLDPDEFLVAAISSDGERIALEMSNDKEMPDVYYHVDTPKKSFSAYVRRNPDGIAPGADDKTDLSAFKVAARKEDEAGNQLTIDFKDASKLEISDNIEGDAGYDVDIEQFDASGKAQRIELNDVGKGDSGADAYQINVGGWDGSSKIGVKHDEEGDGFADDEEEPDENEDNGIEDDDPDGSGLIGYFYPSIDWGRSSK